MKTTQFGYDFTICENGILAHNNLFGEDTTEDFMIKSGHLPSDDAEAMIMILQSAEDPKEPENR